jgi:hypothetical protein
VGGEGRVPRLETVNPSRASRRAEAHALDVAVELRRAHVGDLQILDLDRVRLANVDDRQESPRKTTKSRSPSSSRSARQAW